jgi:hypothetical protein
MPDTTEALFVATEALRAATEITNRASNRICDLVRIAGYTTSLYASDPNSGCGEHHSSSPAGMDLDETTFSWSEKLKDYVFSGHFKDRFEGGYDAWVELRLPYVMLDDAEWADFMASEAQRVAHAKAVRDHNKRKADLKEKVDAVAKLQAEIEREARELGIWSE